MAIEKAQELWNASIRQKLSISSLVQANTAVFVGIILSYALKLQAPTLCIHIEHFLMSYLQHFRSCECYNLILPPSRQSYERPVIHHVPVESSVRPDLFDPAFLPNVMSIEGIHWAGAFDVGDNGEAGVDFAHHKKALKYSARGCAEAKDKECMRDAASATAHADESPPCLPEKEKKEKKQQKKQRITKPPAQSSASNERSDWHMKWATASKDTVDTALLKKRRAGKYGRLLDAYGRKCHNVQASHNRQSVESPAFRETRSFYGKDNKHQRIQSFYARQRDVADSKPKPAETQTNETTEKFVLRGLSPHGSFSSIPLGSSQIAVVSVAKSLALDNESGPRCRATISLRLNNLQSPSEYSFRVPLGRLRDANTQSTYRSLPARQPGSKTKTIFSPKRHNANYFPETIYIVIWEPPLDAAMPSQRSLPDSASGPRSTFSNAETMLDSSQYPPNITYNHLILPTGQSNAINALPTGQSSIVNALRSTRPYTHPSPLEPPSIPRCSLLYELYRSNRNPTPIPTARPQHLSRRPLPLSAHATRNPHRPTPWQRVKSDDDTTPPPSWVKSVRTVGTATTRNSNTTTAALDAPRHYFLLGTMKEFDDFATHQSRAISALRSRPASLPAPPNAVHGPLILGLDTGPLGAHRRPSGTIFSTFHQIVPSVYSSADPHRPTPWQRVKSDDAWLKSAGVVVAAKVLLLCWGRR